MSSADGARRAVGLSLLASELLTLFRRWRTWAMLAALALIPILIGIAIRVAGGASPGRGPAFLDQIGAIEKAKPSASRDEAVRTLVRLVAPMIPHLAEEAWATLGNETLVADAEWPEFDPAMLVEDQVTIAVQVNGKLRDTLTVPRGESRETLEAMALAAPNVVRLLAGAAPKKVVVVPDRLVNLVA